MITQSHTICFSPTQTGALVLGAVQRGVQIEPHRQIDLTLETTPPPAAFSEQDLVIIGMPVYAGRLPAPAAERFKAVRGNGAKAVAVVIYGNRAIEDALLELSDLCEQQGFQLIAAAAFIGEHSYSSGARPIAPGRPDTSDLQKAERFGELICKQLATPDDLVPPSVPGSRPYKDGMVPGGAAADSDPRSCIQCGLCETFCPTRAITLTGEGPETDPEACIWCMACVKACTSHARTATHPKIKEIAERLYQSCQTRKEPEWFLASTQENRK